MMQEYLTEKELANRSKLSLSTLRNYRAERKIFPFIKIGRSVRYPVSEIEKILEDKVIKAE